MGFSQVYHPEGLKRTLLSQVLPNGSSGMVGGAYMPGTWEEEEPPIVRATPGSGSHVLLISNNEVSHFLLLPSLLYQPWAAHALPS